MNFNHQDALNTTVGRVTNEDLERTDCVLFKTEDVRRDGEEFGPVYISFGEQIVAMSLPGEVEWWSEHFARALAEALNVPLAIS